MDLGAWRESRQAGEQFTLPSGLVMRLRRVSLMDLATQGEIPAPLVGLVESLLQRDSVELSLEEFGQYGRVTGLVAKAAAVDPPVADEADGEHLGVDELPMADRIAIFNWANGGVRSLRPFRPEAAESVDAA